MGVIIDRVGFLMDDPFVLLIVFFILAVANFFFPPIPLESLTLLGGYLTGIGRGSLIMIILAATSGMFTGSMILFWLARRFGNSMFTRIPFPKITPDFYQKTARWFDKYGSWSIFFGKVIPGMSLVTVVFSGILGWKTAKASLIIFGSNLVFYAVLGITGQIIGANWGKVANWLKRLNILGLGILGFLVVGVIIHILYRRSKVS
jgi:membrane protein DedA with SNARE-associated domain